MVASLVVQVRGDLGALHDLIAVVRAGQHRLHPRGKLVAEDRDLALVVARGDRERPDDVEGEGVLVHGDAGLRVVEPGGAVRGAVHLQGGRGVVVGVVDARAGGLAGQFDRLVRPQLERLVVRRLRRRLGRRRPVQQPVEEGGNRAVVIGFALGEHRRLHGDGFLGFPLECDRLGIAVADRVGRDARVVGGAGDRPQPVGIGGARRDRILVPHDILQGGHGEIVESQDAVDVLGPVLRGVAGAVQRDGGVVFGTGILHDKIGQQPAAAVMKPVGGVIGHPLQKGAGGPIVAVELFERLVRKGEQQALPVGHRRVGIDARGRTAQCLAHAHGEADGVAHLIGHVRSLEIRPDGHHRVVAGQVERLLLVVLLGVRLGGGASVDGEADGALPQEGVGEMDLASGGIGHGRVEGQPVQPELRRVGPADVGRGVVADIRHRAGQLIPAVAIALMPKVVLSVGKGIGPA